MIASMIRAALSQRLVVVVLALVVCGFGLRAAMKLSVDAFPDVTNVQVQSRPKPRAVRPRKSSAS